MVLWVCQLVVYKDDLLDMVVGVVRESHLEPNNQQTRHPANTVHPSLNLIFQSWVPWLCKMFGQNLMNPIVNLFLYLAKVGVEVLEGCLCNVDLRL